MDHIRAPWQIVWGSPGRTVRAPRIVDALGEPVVAFGNQVRRQGRARVCARANLVVGAPDMLALCRDLYAEVGKGGDLDWHLCEQGYAERLRVLIEKADGG